MATSADTQINFGFTNPGTWYPTASPATPVNYIDAYWAAGTTLNTVIGDPIGSLSVYWNEAGSGTGGNTASIQGISPATIPAGAKFVLIVVRGSTSNLVPIGVPPTVTGLSPAGGPLGGALVSVSGTNLAGATKVYFGNTAVTSGLTVFNAVHPFTTAIGDGNNPFGDLTLGGSTLYGMTLGPNFGTIFSVNTDGSGYTDLYDFLNNATSGANPHGSLTLIGSTLYGMTSQGGANGDGTIFSIGTDGTGYKDLWDFDGADGALPTGA